MRSFSTTRFGLALAAVVAFALTDTAGAQYVPYGGYGNSGWGGWPRAGVTYISQDAMAAQQGADRRQSLALNAAQQQSRNDLLLSEAQRRTAAINQDQQVREGLRTSVAAEQARQNAAWASSPSAGLGRLPPTPISKSAAAAEPGTRWPTLLNDSRFAVPRTKLERLLTDAASPKEGLTSAEYDEIVKQAEQMKDVMRGMAAELNAAEYLAVERFLNDLIAKAKAAANPKP